MRKKLSFFNTNLKNICLSFSCNCRVPSIALSNRFPIIIHKLYGGGFHFRDFLPCFITSILSLLGILELLQYIRLEILPCILISSLSLLFIFLIAPVPSIVDDFTTEELRIRKYKLFHIIWIMEVFVIFLAFIKQKHLLHLFMITFLFTSSIMVAGKIRIFYYNKIITKEKTDD